MDLAGQAWSFIADDVGTHVVTSKYDRLTEYHHKARPCQFRGIGRRDKEQWLLIEKDDSKADRGREPTRTQPESVLSGRTNEEHEQT